MGAFFLLALILEFDREDTRHAMSLLLLAFFVFFYGLRWETGTDWLPYLQYFNTTAFDYFEWGYKQFCLFVKIFTTNYTFFLLVHATIVFGGFYAFVRGNFRYQSLALITIFAFLFPYMGASRQFLAMSCGFVALGLFLRGRHLYTFCLILLASLIHQTAILFLLVFLFARVKMDNRAVIKFLAGIFVLRLLASEGLAMLSSMSLPQSIEMRLVQYVQIFPYDASYFALGIVRKMIPLIMLCMLDDGRDTWLYKSFYLMAILFYVVPYGYAQIFVSRFTLYFEVFGYLGLAKALERRPRDRMTFAAFWIIVGLVGVHFALSIRTNYSLYFPYKGVLVNSEFIRALY